MNDALLDAPVASGSRPASYASSNSSIEERGLFDDLAYLDQATAVQAKPKAKVGWLGRQKAKKSSTDNVPKTPSKAKAPPPAPPRTMTYPDSPEQEMGMFADLATLAEREEYDRPSTPSSSRRFGLGKKFGTPKIGSLSRRGGVRGGVLPKSLAQSTTSSSRSGSIKSTSTITSFSTIGKAYYPPYSPTPTSPAPHTARPVSSAYSTYTAYTASLRGEEKQDENAQMETAISPVLAAHESPAPDLDPAPVDAPVPSVLAASPRKNTLRQGNSPILASVDLPSPPAGPQAAVPSFPWGARRPSTSPRESNVFPSRQPVATSSQSPSINPRARVPSDRGSLRRRPSSPTFMSVDSRQPSAYSDGFDSRRPSGYSDGLDSRRPSGFSEGFDSRRGSMLLSGPSGRKLSHALTLDSHRGSVAESIASPRFAAMVDDFPRPPSVMLPPAMSPIRRRQSQRSSPGSASPTHRRPSYPPPPPPPPLEASLPESPTLQPADRLSGSSLLDLTSRLPSRHISAGSGSSDMSPDLKTPGTPTSPAFHQQNSHHAPPRLNLPVEDDLTSLLASSHLSKPEPIHEHARPESVMLPDFEFPAGIPAVESPSVYTAEQVVSEYLAVAPQQSRARTASQPERRARSGSIAQVVAPVPVRPRRRSSAPHRCPTPTGHRSRPSLPPSPPPPVPSHPSLPHMRADSVSWARPMGAAML